jgi:hypothetical protein
MAKNEQKRQKLFPLYLTNIKLITNRLGWKLGFENESGKFVKVEEPYICPICNQIFSSELLIQTDDNLNPLTLEDVPPKKLGGKPILLTCKNCNNEIGGKKLDSKLIWNLEMEPYYK